MWRKNAFWVEYFVPFILQLIFHFSFRGRIKLVSSSYFAIEIRIGSTNIVHIYRKRIIKRCIGKLQNTVTEESQNKCTRKCKIQEIIFKPDLEREKKTIWKKVRKENLNWRETKQKNYRSKFNHLQFYLWFTWAGSNQKRNNSQFPVYIIECLI